jgi:hypothetical protein
MRYSRLLKFRLKTGCLHPPPFQSSLFIAAGAHKVGAALAFGGPG